MNYPCFNRRNCLGGLGLIGALFMVSAVQAQDRVAVTQVVFSQMRPPGDTSGQWLEFAIQLQTRTDREQLGRVSDQIKISVTLGYERAQAGGQRDWQFFRASMQVVGLYDGRSVVRFYLPPEIIKRDSVQGSPKFWTVELTGEGMDMSPTRRNYSVALKDRNMLSQFLDKVSNEGAANDGLLQPQHLTPFARMHANDTPTAVQPDSWR